MQPTQSLFIFRQDLRIHDNTGLSAMCESVGNLHALFVITPEQWLQHDMALVQVDLILRTLLVLADDLYRQMGVTLTVLHATDFDDSIKVISQFCQDNHIQQVFANHQYELNEIKRDEQLATRLASQDIRFNRYHDQCILPPNSVQNNDGQMYRVFTPFYKKWSAHLETSQTESEIGNKRGHQTENQIKSQIKSHTPSFYQQGDNNDNSTHQENLNHIQALGQQVLSDYLSAWQNKLADCVELTHEQIEQLLQKTRQQFPAGEVTACHRLDQFVAEEIGEYDTARDVPSLQATSEISPYLAIGSLSPRLCYLQAKKALLSISKQSEQSSKQQNTDKGNDKVDNNVKSVNRWISELAWRDFYRHVLVSRPNLIKHQAYLLETDKKVNWSYDKKAFQQWCEGKTGVPLVDSAMRCLNATGYMHNRLRMVTAMFLTKDLLIDWRWGERYFMQTLIDGDFASNNGGWQWSASTGTDAAPYFRIMNPFSQGKTHDPDALFIKKWLPELQDVPTKILHDEKKLTQFLQTQLFVNYPKPIVDHKQARLKAIDAFKS